MKKIIVLSLGNSVTGGTELLQQLVHSLRLKGLNAGIAYYPLDKKFETPEAFKKYDCPQFEVTDDENTIIVIPEVRTKYLKTFKKAQIIIWWLSVDNFIKNHKNKRIDKRIAAYFTYIHKMYQVRNHFGKYLNLSQSRYSTDFLAINGVKSEYLSDYINTDFNSFDPSKKENIILYNPSKGFEKTSKLIEKYKDFTFIPLKGLSREQLKDLLMRAKVYIDFGQHPGKDRIPREAAICGCCVITGIQGSAANESDIPIPSKYKLNDNSSEFIDKFQPLVVSIFDNYAVHSQDFDHYRNFIISEKALFDAQAYEIFKRESGA